jgi:hypothetical protein
MENESFKELLKQEGISDPENPSNKDILKLLELNSNNKIDSTLLKEYFQFLTGTKPKVLDTLKSFAAENVSKDYIQSINKRIDVLNKEYESCKTEDEKDRNHQNILELYTLIKKESDDQRKWITNLSLATLGTVVVAGGIAITVRNKEAGKRIVEEGLKAIKG